MHTDSLTDFETVMYIVYLSPFMIKVIEIALIRIFFRQSAFRTP